MTIYKGNNKIKTIHKNNVTFKEIYKGNQRVYQSLNGLKIYNYRTYYDNYWYYGYVINEISANSLVAVGVGSATDAFVTITNITGTIGVSNSRITANKVTYDYVNTKTVNNIKIYLYSHSEAYLYSLILVLENSKIGSIVLSDMLSWDYSFHYPTYVDNSKLKTPSLTIELQRNSADDKTWTINGVY